MFRDTHRHYRELTAPPPGMAFDYTQPAGEPALVAADSITWRVFKNPVAQFIGGAAAVILQLAEPSVRTGVWDHSTFRSDAILRMRRTAAAAMMVVYGPRSAAEKMIARVVRMHERVSGETPAGEAYHANDPRLLNWVQATASYGFGEAYSRFVRRLSGSERTLLLQESLTAARLFGATDVPRSPHEWEAFYRETEPRLERSDIVFEFLDILNTAPIAPAPFRGTQRLLVRAAVDTIPTDLRERLGLMSAGLTPFQRMQVRVLARIADHVPDLQAPPAKASIRMGHRPTFLYY